MSFPTRPKHISVNEKACIWENTLTVLPFVSNRKWYLCRTRTANDSAWCSDFIYLFILCHQVPHCSPLRGGGRRQPHSCTQTHTRPHTHSHTPLQREKWDWTAMKDLKASGSYLTNLKVNDFSVSLCARLNSVSAIASVMSMTCRFGKCVSGAALYACMPPISGSLEKTQ